MEQINAAHGRAAGDLAIAEVFNRVEREIDETMLFFRIGGDEFAVVTAFEGEDAAKALAMKITERNGEPFFRADGVPVPLLLRAGISRMSEDAMNYRETLERAYSALQKARDSQDFVGAV